MSCYVDGMYSDKIDQSISAKQSEPLVIICALCGSVYQKSKIKCDTCKVNLHASQERNLPDVQVKLSVNPNSFDSVKLVLRKIGITAGISGYKNETNTNDRQCFFFLCVMVYHTAWPISLYIMHIIA